MEGGVTEKQSSYTYWVRESTGDAAPLPVPRKLTPEDISKQPQSASLGSVWNQVVSMDAFSFLTSHYLLTVLAFGVIIMMSYRF